HCPLDLPQRPAPVLPERRQRANLGEGGDFVASGARALNQGIDGRKAGSIGLRAGTVNSRLRALSLEPWGHFRPVPRTHVAEPEARPHFFEHRLVVRAALGTMHSWNLGTWNLRPCALSLEPCALYRLPLLDPPPGFFSQAAH